MEIQDRPVNQDSKVNRETVYVYISSNHFILNYVAFNLLSRYLVY